MSDTDTTQSTSKEETPEQLAAGLFGEGSKQIAEGVEKIISGVGLFLSNLITEATQPTPKDKPKDE